MTVARILAVKGRVVTTVLPHRTVEETVAILAEKRIGAIVVTGSDGEVLGIISERDIVKALANANVLTVGESEDFLDKGGMINFVVDRKKVSFEISQGTAEKANLKMDLQLLKLARAVHTPMGTIRIKG